MEVPGQRFIGHGQCHPECYAALGGNVVCVFDEEESNHVAAVSTPPSPVLCATNTFNTKAFSMTERVQLRRSWLGTPHPPQDWVLSQGFKPTPPCTPTDSLPVKLTSFKNISMPCVHFQDEMDSSHECRHFENNKS